jgi:hypothetical protein
MTEADRGRSTVLAAAVPSPFGALVTSVCCWREEFAPKEKRGQSTRRASQWSRFFSALILIEMRKATIP